MAVISRKIVFAEDNVSIAKIVKNKLISEGFEIFHFPNGKGILDAVIEHKPDLVILDINMPGKDGLTVLKELKDNKETATVSVLLLTATKDENTVIKSIELGVSDYITKPFSLDVIMSRINKIVRGNYNA